MIYAIEYLTGALRRARQTKKLSQRALSQRVGMPQAQISKIENAAVDLKTSNLVALARALDLEVMLVPRKLVPAMRALLRDADRAQNGSPLPPAYTLDDEQDGG